MRVRHLYLSSRLPAHGTEDNEYPSKRYKDLMAEEVLEAIKNGKTFHLGRKDAANPYHGLYVSVCAQQTLSYVFTVWILTESGRKGLDDIYAEKLLDRMVSLAVDIKGHTLQGLPQLETTTRIDEMCIVDEDPARDVIFTYLTSLTLKEIHQDYNRQDLG